MVQTEDWREEAVEARLEYALIKVIQDISHYNNV